MPTLSTEAAQGDTIGAVESVKSASDINTPVSGKIVAVNEILAEKPAAINKGPETDGWIAKLEVGEQAVGEIEELMGSEKYQEFTSAEE